MLYIKVRDTALKIWEGRCLLLFLPKGWQTTCWATTTLTLQWQKWGVPGISDCIEHINVLSQIFLYSKGRLSVVWLDFYSECIWDSSTQVKSADVGKIPWTCFERRKLHMTTWKDISDISRHPREKHKEAQKEQVIPYLCQFYEGRREGTEDECERMWFTGTSNRNRQSCWN